MLCCYCHCCCCRRFCDMFSHTSHCNQLQRLKNVLPLKAKNMEFFKLSDSRVMNTHSHTSAHTRNRVLFGIRQFYVCCVVQQAATTELLQFELQPKKKKNKTSLTHVSKISERCNKWFMTGGLTVRMDGVILVMGVWQQDSWKNHENAINRFINKWYGKGRFLYRRPITICQHF